jgi:hypothetical protein
MKNNKRLVYFHIFCFVIGFLVPIIMSSVKKEEVIVISLNPEKYEKEFLRNPSITLLDSINANTLSCLSHDLEYDDLIYYWILKDSSSYISNKNESVSFHYTILNCFTDSTQYYTPNEDMLEFSKNVSEILQNKR